METNAKKNNAALFILLLITMCLGSYYLGVRRGAAKAGNAVARQEERLANAHADALSGRDPTGIPPADEQNDTERRVVRAGDSGAGREEIESEQKQRLMRNISANLEMPGMNRIIQEQQRVLMADQYRDLVETYGLNEEEKEYFLSLLTTRQMFRVDMGMKLMTGMLSEEERNELLRQVGAGIEQINEEIDWFLNNETDSEYFQFFERTEGERAIVNSLGDRLSQAGNPLAEGMDRELIAIMHEEISAYPFSVEFEENGEPVFSRFTDSNIDMFVGEMQGLRDPVMQQAAQVLDAQQLEVLAASFDQYVAFYDQRMRMVQQLFNPAP